MATTSKIDHNNKRKKLVKMNLKRRDELRTKSKDLKISLEERMEARRTLTKMRRNSAEIRVRNRCELTGRPRAFLRKFGLCRIKFRELALKGEIPGVVKSSW